MVDYRFLLKIAFLLLHENFLFTFYYIFVIEYGPIIIVVIFQTKVFIIVKQFEISPVALVRLISIISPKSPQLTIAQKRLHMVHASL